jgi:hypothetical protein
MAVPLGTGLALCRGQKAAPVVAAEATESAARGRVIAMPLIMWLLGVPLGLIVVLWLMGVV